MSPASLFLIYNASAGSGKTYTLVKEYLKILLGSEDLYKFQKILAITFTNKAAYEMKERVLNNLKQFGEDENNVLLLAIAHELNKDSLTLQKRSRKILQAILENYTAFSITTIDSFTHKIIKSFAFDLGLSQNFEVEMETEELLRAAVEMLLSKIGRDREITQVLIQYAKDKSNKDRSWDISRDLLEFSNILLKEQDAKHLQKIADKSFEDFLALDTKLKLQNQDKEKELSTLGGQGLEKMQHLGLDFSDFTRSTFPKLLLKLNHFSDLPGKELSFPESVDKVFNHESPAYPKRISEDKKICIDKHLVFFSQLYERAKDLYTSFRFNHLMLKSIIPLATLKFVYRELQALKEEGNVQLNAEFNHLISRHIQDQPAPFIYERIGNKFRHYFIDEMQDTSVMQWSNLIPLLQNTLAQESSSLMLVGDAKQSIYRWRGGKAEQFIDLGNKDDDMNPFPIPKDIKTLKTNYRSFQEVVAFNNQFFTFIAKQLQDQNYQQLFQQTACQEVLDSKEGGFVSINFVSDDKEIEEPDLRFPKAVLEIIQSAREEFRLHEICVIVRKRAEGVAIAEYLTSYDIPIVSSETLLLSNSPKVEFLMNLLAYTFQENDDLKFDLLDFVYHHFKIKESKHDFMIDRIDKNQLFEGLGVDFQLTAFKALSLYEKMEYTINSLSLMNESDAYLQFFLDEVLRWQHKEMGIAEILSHWDLNKDKLSIVTPQGLNAVQIMTIHKSKGLEFPVVIYAGDVKIYADKSNFWLDSSIHGFQDFLLPRSTELANLNDQTSQIYKKRQRELELDAVNLLYVTLTRAQEQLFVVTSERVFKEGKIDAFSDYFKAYLKERDCLEEGQKSYDFGDRKRRKIKPLVHDEKHHYQNEFLSGTRVDQSIEILSNASNLWGTNQQEAINYGNKIHEILAKIRTKQDVDRILSDELNKGHMTQQDFKEIQMKIHDIVDHPKLEPYYNKGLRVFNERLLADVDGQLMIPDRLIFLDNEVIILDYKTGAKHHSHQQQLLKYERLIKNLGYSNVKKVLVYLSEPFLVEEF